MSIKFEDLYPKMIPHLRSCPKRVVLPQLYLGAQLFCERSEVWRYDETTDIVAAQTAYTLGLPTGVTSIDTVKIKRLQTVWYGTDSGDKEEGQIVDTDKYAFTYPDQLVFNDAYPDALTDGLTTQIVLVPTLKDHELTDEMMDRWAARGFMAWALWDLLSMKEQTWTDKDRARVWKTRYDRALAEARRTRFVQNKGGDLRVKARAYV